MAKVTKLSNNETIARKEREEQRHFENEPPMLQMLAMLIAKGKLTDADAAHMFRELEIVQIERRVGHNMARLFQTLDTMRGR